MSAPLDDDPRPRDKPRAAVASALMVLFAVVTSLGWLVANGVIALMAGRAPPWWTWPALGFGGVLVGAVAGFLPIKLRTPQVVSWIPFVLAFAGLAMALAFNR